MLPNSLHNFQKVNSKSNHSPQADLVTTKSHSEEKTILNNPKNLSLLKNSYSNLPTKPRKLSKAMQQTRSKVYRQCKV